MMTMAWTHGLDDKESYLDRAYSSRTSEFITRWANDAVGSMVDLLGDNTLRFVDYYYKPGHGEEDDVLLKNHTTEEEELACPVVAEGIVTYWLRYRKQKGTAEIFEEYFSQQKNLYVTSHRNEPDAWERNLEEEFTTHKHIHEELKRIEHTVLAIKEYVGEEDTSTISEFAENYLRFVRRKSKTLFPPKYPENRKIEDEFIDTFAGPARDCMEWIRDEYNIPYMRPHKPFFKKPAQLPQQQDRPLTEGELVWKRHHEIDVPRYVRWGFEDYNSDVLHYADGGLMDEIENNLRSLNDKEERIRYVVSLLLPFKQFADAFYPMARIRQREREIEMHTKAIERWSEVKEGEVDDRTGKPLNPTEQIEAGKRMIEHCHEDIEYWNEVEKKFYNIVQSVFHKDKVEGKMEYYLCEFWSDMIYFARHLAALLLTFHIKLPDVQERCGVYLMWHYDLTDYEDMVYISDFSYARQLLDEIENEKASEAAPAAEKENSKGKQKSGSSAGTHFNKTIFHDNLDEAKIAHALSGIDRKGCGVKQFTQVVQEFFEGIGWLVNRTDTDFVSWMKHHQIVSMKSKGLTHVQRNEAMDELADGLKQTFQFLNGKHNWEDNYDFYKKDRLKINNGA